MVSKAPTNQPTNQPNKQTTTQTTNQPNKTKHIQANVKVPVIPNSISNPQLIFAMRSIYFTQVS